MLESTLARRRRVRRRLAAPRVLLILMAALFVGAQVAGGWLFFGRAPRAGASPSISQIYFTPYEAQQYMDILRAIAGDPGCCSGPLLSTVSITSGAAGNTVVYDHFEDGYEIDPYNPVQGSTVTLSLGDGDVWDQTSSIPVDQPGRGAGFYFDGRDRIVSSAPIAVTQTAFASTPGSLHAGAVEVLDLDKSGTAFDIPVGQNADYNSVFEYVGLMIVGNQRGTAAQVDADADGSFEITAALDEGETYLVSGGVNLGARVTADHPVAVYVLTGDIGARYEGRDFELYPTAVWSSQLVSPVGARSTDAADGTRVFLFNPGASAVVVDVATSAGAAGTVNLAPRGQGSFLVPVDEGARFTAQGGAPIYAFQAITTELGTGDSTSSYDWGFSLIPVNAATTSVIVPYAPGSTGLTNNYSPVWVTTFTSTTLYVDRDGDRSTGANVDPDGNHYDFSCSVTGLRSYTIYDDGTSNCHLPSQNSAAGGDRDMTGARIYTVDHTRLVSAWGQRSSYVAGAPALDVGTTILPFPSISMAKSSSVVGDADGDGRADPGDTVAYTITMTNLGIIDVGAVLLTDEVPDYSGYLAASTTLDGVPQADDALPHTASPLDADSPSGGLAVGTIAAGATRTAVFRVVVDDPLPFGVGSLLNFATMTTSLGNASAANLLPLDAGLRIDKAATAGPVDPGDTIEYTIRVFNGTPTEQTGVDLTDTLPAGATFVPGSVAADLNGTPVTAGVPPNLVTGLTMPRGSVLTVTFRATVDVPLPPGTLQLVNGTAASSDQIPGPITDEAVTTVAQSPEPVVVKTPVPASLPEPGGTVTFTVEVQNPSAAAVTLTTLGDDVFGDLRAAGNPLVTNNTCPGAAAAIPAGGSFSCSFDATLVGQAGDPAHADTVTATVEDGDGRPGTGSATATVPFTDALPSLGVIKTAAPGSVPEPGGAVTFSVEAANLAAEPVTLLSLADDVYGDLLDPANPLVTDNTCPAQPLALPAGGTFSCSFTAYVAGDAGGAAHVDTVAATVSDDDGNVVLADDDAEVAFTDVLPAIATSKTPSAGAIAEPGGVVSFLVAVQNLSAEPVTITALDDDVFGDLLDVGNARVTANNCPVQPAVVPAGGVFACSFDAFVAGDAGGADHADTVTAAAVDDEGNRATAADGAVVAFSDVPPSVSVAKTPSAGAVNERGGVVTFTVEVHNTSVEPVTLSSLNDNVYGNLRLISNPALTDNTCPFQPAVIPVDGTLSCSFDAFVAGDAGGPAHTNTVTALVADNEWNWAGDADDAVIAFGDVAPTIDVAKEAATGTVPEPGAVVLFTVAVHNTSPEGATVTSLLDSVFGDLLDPANTAVSSNTCPAQPAALPPGGTFSCSFEALVTGDAGGPDHVGTVRAIVRDGEGNTASSADDAAVAFTDVLPSLAAAKSPSAGTVAEPGGPVTFTVEVENLSSEAVTLTALADDVFGDLLDRDNPAVEDNTCPAQVATLPPAGGFSCSFRALVVGDFGDPAHRDTVTATAADDEGNAATASAEAEVRFGELLPSLAVDKAPSVGSVPEAGGVVTFMVEVANTSAEPVSLASLADDVFGDLLDPANPEVSANTCPAQPALIPGDGTLACSFAAYVAGDAGGPDHVDTVTAVAEDDEGHFASAADVAVVAFGDAVPTIDVAKRADPGRVPESGAVVAFQVTVHNTGPEAVALTALADDVFGDLLDSANPLVSANTCPGQDPAVPPGGALACSFDAFLSGDAGGPDHAGTVTATAVDDEGNPASASGRAQVAFDDVLPSLRAAKTAAPSAVDESGGIVAFMVSVENTSVEEVALTSLDDSVFGDLRDPGNLAVFANTCPAQPAAIPAGGTLTCSFEGLVDGEPGGPGHVDTVSAAAVDDEGNPASAGAAATVTIVATQAVVTGHLFVDLDGDGAQGPGEPHLSGGHVRLVDGAGLRRTVVSDALGDWEAPVPAGVVSLRVVAATVPAGYRLTTANAAQTVSTPPGANIATADVGYQPADGSLGGKVFFDVNGDEAHGAGEPAFAGVAVALYDGDRLLGTVLTVADGSYRFADLAAGEYRVVVRDDANRFAGFRATLDPDGTLDGETAVALGTSEDRTGLDFAYRGTGTLGDTVWNDADGDEAQDPAEGKISGVVVGLVWSGFDGALGSGDDVTFPPQTTGAAGTYLFTGVPPGVVAAAVDPASVDPDFEPTTATSHTYDLGSREAFLDGDIGFRERGELPYTGFDADRLGLLSLGLVALGLLLLAAGRRGRRNEGLRWERLQ